MRAYSTEGERLNADVISCSSMREGDGKASFTRAFVPMGRKLIPMHV